MTNRANKAVDHVLGQAIVPLNPKPMEDEWFGSWLSRIAHANTMFLSSLLYYLYSTGDISLEPQDLPEVAKKLRISPTSLVKTLNTPLPHANPANIRGKSANLAGNAWLSVCPICLELDSVPYIRIKWMNRRIDTCEIHNIRLIQECPDCHHLLIPVSKFKAITGTILTWDSPICFCQTCGKDLRQATVKEGKYQKVESIGSSSLTPDEEQRWLDALYLVFEKCHLAMYIDPISLEKLYPERIKAMTQNDIEKNTLFFNKLLSTLIIKGTSTIDIKQLRRLGATCQSLEKTSKGRERYLWITHWLASLMEHASESYLAFNFPSVALKLALTLNKTHKVFYFTIDYNHWPKIKQKMEAFGYPPGPYGRVTLLRLYRRFCGPGFNSQANLTERAKRFYGDGTFNAFVAAVYLLYQKGIAEYDMDATWLTYSVLEYVRLNNSSIFEASLLHLSREYSNDDPIYDEGSPCRYHLSNLALSLGKFKPGQLADYVSESIKLTSSIKNF